MSLELPHNKHTLILWGVGIGGSLIAMYLWSKFSGSSSTNSGASNVGAAYLAAAQAQAQYQQQQAAMNLQSQQLADSTSLQQSQIQANTQQAAMQAGSNLANGIAQLGAVNVQSALQTVQNVYAADYAAGTSIADNALQGAATVASTNLGGMAINEASANKAIGTAIGGINSMTAGINSSTNGIIASAAQTTQAATQANAAASAQQSQTDTALASIAVLALA